MSDPDRTTEALAELLRGERRRSTTLTLCLSFLGIAVVALLWRMGDNSSAKEGSGGGTAEAAALVSLRKEWQETEERLEARIRELEAQDTSAGRAGAPPEVNGDALGGTVTPAVATINLTGRPDPSRDSEASSATIGTDQPWQDSVAKALKLGEQIRQDLDREEQEVEDQKTRRGDVGSATTPAKETPDEENGYTTPRDATALSLPLLTAANQFLEDAGLSRYRLVEALESPQDAGLFDVLLALRPDATNAGGTIRADRMWLRVHPISREAQWILERAQGTSGGVRIEYPHRTLVLDISGVVPPDLVPAPLAEVLGLQGKRTLPEPLMDTPRVTERFNQRLAEEKLEVRVVSIGSTEEGRLIDVVVDLGRLPGRDQREEVRAARAWWELDESRHVLTLICEEGSLVVDDVARPFFRGTWRRSFSNIHPEAWRTLPAVRRKDPPGAASPGSGD